MLTAIQIRRKLRQRLPDALKKKPRRAARLRRSKLARKTSAGLRRSSETLRMPPKPLPLLTLLLLVALQSLLTTTPRSRMRTKTSTLIVLLRSTLRTLLLQMVPLLTEPAL